MTELDRSLPAAVKLACSLSELGRCTERAVGLCYLDKPLAQHGADGQYRTLNPLEFYLAQRPRLSAISCTGPDKSLHPDDISYPGRFAQGAAILVFMSASSELLAHVPSGIWR
jgi:hypothetical protein